MADQAGAWGAARAEAIADGRVESSTVLPPSNTNLALLPVVPDEVEDEPEPAPDLVDAEDDPADETPVEPDPAADPDAEPDPAADPDAEPDPDAAADPDAEPDPDAAVDPDAEPDPDAVADPEPDPADVDPDPVTDPDETEPIQDDPPVIDDDDLIDEPRSPKAPAQVNGRVPPPAGGPTGAQWDAVRRCESTHNYRAISPSGLYRGAYQFSQQTWDWVAGIHQPHLVGIDPIDAEPAWQDVMAYTLYAMRGWDQWPICGKNLL